MSLLPPQRVLDAMAKHCRSCGECGETPPCQTCMAGGVCFAGCTCHEGPDEDAAYFDNDDDEQAEETSAPVAREKERTT